MKLGHFDPVEIMFKQIAITLAYISLRTWGKVQRNP